MKYQYFTRFGEKCVAYNINTNMKLFGDYVIIIDNQLELLERIRKAVEKEKIQIFCVGQLNIEFKIRWKTCSKGELCYT